MNNTQTLLKGIIKENPVLVLLLGTCPTLAVTSDVKSAVGMAAAAAIVLILSNLAISLLRNIIPDKVRIPCYIVVIAGFVTVVEMLMHAFFPEIYSALGIFLSLIVVNCIILGRAEMFASKNGVVASIMDGIGMAIGFAIALVAMATIREVFGAGAFFGIEIPFLKDYTIPILTSAPGGFFVFGLLIAIVNKFLSKKRKPKAEFGCEGCPSANSCNKTDCEKEAE
ncbi:MAG: electron transport complex subunit E [Clostridia bacterium]|nr:electron transport complex subunit E [Clostridia bacterium]